MNGDSEANKAAGGYREGRRTRTCGLVLRLLAMALTLAAAVVLGVDKQTKTVPVQVGSGLPPLHVPVTAKWHYLSAFVYFVVANAVASGYAALSLLLLFANKAGKSRALASAVAIADIIMVALLFSGSGAATAIGVIGHDGNSHVQWGKVCNVFDKFCDRVAISIVLSLVGSLAFVIMGGLAVLG
ncbi:CASP-like protein 1E1 [Rhodamnia argentea]|uniref:CASP-like protein n=1 Tax=Rhodamnia argentea TaxID=178133 RepID=A0A8B8QW91_9MYRT|nr:CASP-like protein 1E1 [Rhodamnia argentea]